MGVVLKQLNCPILALTVVFKPVDRIVNDQITETIPVGVVNFLIFSIQQIDDKKSLSKKR